MRTEDIKTVAIIGAGFIGPGIAQVFASRGYAVYLMDIKTEMLTRASDSLKANLHQMAEAGVMPEVRNWLQSSKKSTSPATPVKR